MDEQANADREHQRWLGEVDELASLVKHPGWPIYAEQVIDVVISDLRTMLFDSKLDDIGVIQAIRFMLKTLVKLRDRPQELLRTARSFRESRGIPQPNEETDAGTAR